MSDETIGCSHENYVIIINDIIRELSCAPKIITCEPFSGGTIYFFIFWAGGLGGGGLHVY